MKYSLSAQVTCSIYTTVDADSEEEAIKLASNRHIVISAYGGDNEEDWILDDADGIPDKIKLGE